MRWPLARIASSDRFRWIRLPRSRASSSSRSRRNRSRRMRRRLKKASTPTMSEPCRIANAPPLRNLAPATTSLGLALLSRRRSAAQYGVPVFHTTPRMPLPRKTLFSRRRAVNRSSSGDGRCQPCSQRRTSASRSTTQNSPISQPSSSQMPCSMRGAASAQVGAVANGSVTATRRLVGRTPTSGGTSSRTRDTRLICSPGPCGEASISSIGKAWPSR